MVQKKLLKTTLTSNGKTLEEWEDTLEYCGECPFLGFTSRTTYGCQRIDGHKISVEDIWKKGMIPEECPLEDYTNDKTKD